MPYNKLSEPIRRYIRDKKWKELRPIQAAAISRIMESKENYILASRTASGKTEAAFLPILSKIDFTQPGVQVLYISPLIALINDQFNRIEELCSHLDVPVTKWHGEAHKALKERLLNKPEGIVLITPESLEAMFVNKYQNVVNLFSNLKYVIIDEIHSFIGTERGVQLKSLLSRLQHINSEKFSLIGLSATIGDYDLAKKFTGDSSHTKVLLDKTAKPVNAEFRYFLKETTELPLPLLKDLYIESRDSKMLIFPNTRGRVEEIAVKLKKISDRVGGHVNYFSHHSSVERQVREYIEYFTKTNERKAFAVCCTSTLELGIDIGSVDKVVQIDATNSVSSLIQRLGRSGRKEGSTSQLLLYATNEWQLLQSVACWELFKEGKIDPPNSNGFPYDILVHQILSIVKGRSGVDKTDLWDQIQFNAAFEGLQNEEFEEIITHLSNTQILEYINGELILGLEGEFKVNTKDFYSVFTANDELTVISEGNVIGSVPFSESVVINHNLYLAAKIWKIISVDLKSNKLYVIPTSYGIKPDYFGSGAPVHPLIREKMQQILLLNSKPDYLDDITYNEIVKLKEFLKPVVDHSDRCELYTFTGTKANRAISLLLTIAGISNGINETASQLDVEAPVARLKEVLPQLPALAAEVDDYLISQLAEKPHLLKFSKWGGLLPLKYQMLLLKSSRYNVVEGVEVLQSILKAM